MGTQFNAIHGARFAVAAAIQTVAAIANLPHGIMKNLLVMPPSDHTALQCLSMRGTSHFIKIEMNACGVYALALLNLWTTQGGVNALVHQIPIDLLKHLINIAGLGAKECTLAVWN